MDWFTALGSPTQVAIIGVITAFIGAGATVLVTLLKSRGEGGGRAEIAAMTVDTTALTRVAGALESLGTALVDQNGVGKDLTDQVEELRREVRALSDKLRTR